MTQLESVPLDDGKGLEELTTREITQVMVKVQRMRHGRVKALEDLTAGLGKAKKEATEAHAKAFLAHEGPQEERTQVAKQAAANAVFLADVAKGKLDACKARMDVLKDDWDTCRSAGANERAERSATEGFGS
jgi:hypothetical protein